MAETVKDPVGEMTWSYYGLEKMHESLSRFDLIFPKWNSSIQLFELIVLSVLFW